MTKRIYLQIVAILFICFESHAQSMTYNHDASKQGQIQVMELGAGNLTPELYYTVTHRRYKNGAKAVTSVKNTLRIAANTASIPQVEYADSIQADLEGRAKIEAANIVDRQVDLAWVTEGNKIEGKLLAFKNNINALNGKAKTEEITNWTELGQMYDFAIKAIVDEDIKAVDGSRVRLRLLDDIDVGDRTIPSGSYLYCTMSGFSQQRVKGTVKSVLIDDELVKVNLSIYDTDGMEGLYVPRSSFRETTQDVASGAMSQSMSLNDGSATSSMGRWGMQALQNAYQKTANAISKNIRKNKVNIKYGTQVYLINSKEKRQTK